MTGVMVIVGTRPEIIKMAPVVRELQANSAEFTFVHCGQHYDYAMSRQFIHELGLPPLGYFDFLLLIKNCEIVLTDSGGLQEEATATPIRKPVLVIRLSTERPEAVEAGFAKVVGVEKETVTKAIENALNERIVLPKVSPYGDGSAGKRIVNIVLNRMKR